MEIPYGVFWDMTDNVNNDEPEVFWNGNRVQVVDNVQGYTLFQYYSTLSPTVISPETFRTSFINRNGTAQATQINALFGSYGY